MVSRSAFLHRVPERVAAGVAALRARGWLSQTPPAFQTAILEVSLWKTARTGEEFSRAGDMEGGLIGIADGTAEVALNTGHPDARFVHLARSGFWSGYRPLLGLPRNVVLSARTDVLWLLVPKRSAERLLREEPGWWRHIASLANEAYEVTVSIMVDLTRQNGLSRVAGTLLRMAGCRVQDPQPSHAAQIQLSQAEIAAAAVMSRNTLGAYLADLASRGLIDISYRSIRIRDARGLRHLLELEE